MEISKSVVNIVMSLATALSLFGFEKFDFKLQENVEGYYTTPSPPPIHLRFRNASLKSKSLQNVKMLKTKSKQTTLINNCLSRYRRLCNTQF